MRRLAIVALLALVAFAGFGAGKGAAYIVGYAGPGAWFSPSEAYATDYDDCHRWTGNNFAKGEDAYGLLTYIKPSGSWSYGIQKYGNIFSDLPEWHWTKKLHCKNNSGSFYQGGCWGERREAQCV